MIDYDQLNAASISLLSSTGTKNYRGAFKRFRLLCTPFVVRALIAENERLKAELECPFRLARHSRRLVEQLREENEVLCKERDSRAAIEVELPPIGDYIYRYGQGNNCDEYVDMVKDAIESLGLKVKP